MNILITICARGGSKGVPNKNIRSLNGIPLIAYSIKMAFQFQKLVENMTVHIALSTDSEKIKSIAATHGLATDYLRPDHLATDSAGKIGAIRDIYNYSKEQNQTDYDYVLDLDATSPLRNMTDLLEGFNQIEAYPEAVNLFSVSEPHRNPYFNMVELSDEGYVNVVKPLGKDVLSRQAAPKVYDINGSFYYYKKAFFEKGYNTATTDKSLSYLMKHVCFDIDNELDFEIMDYLLRENKLDFLDITT